MNLEVNNKVLTNTQRISELTMGDADISTLELQTVGIKKVHKWNEMPECDEFVGARRSKHTAVAYNDAIYVFGGDNGKSMLNDLLRYDVEEKSWGRAISTGTPPAPRYHHSAVVHNTSMFIFGGYTGDIHSNSNLTNKNDLFEYNFCSGQWFEWRFMGKTPVPRSAHGSAIFDNKLWIFAGYDGNARLNDMWTISLTVHGDVKSWEQVEQKGECPPTCCNFPVAVARDSMFVFSGQSGAKITNSLFQFTFRDKTWTRISTEHILRDTPASPARRYGHSMVAFDRHLYVFGGAADSTLSNDLHCFDLDDQTWSVILPHSMSLVPSGRLFHAAAVVGNAMFVFGGTVDNNVRSGEMHRFQFSNHPKCTLHDDYGRLLESQFLADIQFIVGPDEEKILGHVAIVVARSPYLRKRIREAKVERDNYVTEALLESAELSPTDIPLIEVKLPDVDPESFKMVLHYIYTDYMDPTKEAKDGQDPFSVRLVLRMMDIYRLAVKFKMSLLEYLCVQYVNATICVKNSLVAVQKAEDLQLDVIKEFCVRFIIKEHNFNDIIMSSEFDYLDKQLMIMFVRRRHPQAKVTGEIHLEKVGHSLEEDMSTFLNVTGTEFCDFNLSLDGMLIPVHKTILAARCSYFEAMFRSFMPTEKTVDVRLGDFVPSKQSFDSLLRYIYYGDVSFTPLEALYIYAANFYGFSNNRLQVLCREMLETDIGADNLVALLGASYDIGALRVKQYLIDLLVYDYPSLCRSEPLRELDKYLLWEIMKVMAKKLDRQDLLSKALNADT